MLYNSFILPHITYGLEVWGSAYHSYLREILLIQKKIVRIITSSKYDAHSPPLFKKLNILDIFKQYEFQIGIFVHDSLHMRLPSHFDHYFSVPMHPFNTRSKAEHYLQTPKYVSRFGQSSIKYAGPKIWNNIPSHIRDIQQRGNFKSEFKKYLLSLY